MFNDLLQSGGLDVLERTMQFAGKRHELITHNIANLSTPGFRPTDVDPKSFQEEMARAVKERRNAVGMAKQEPIQLRSTGEVEFKNGTMELHPTPIGANIMFHDGNDRDLERTMQSLAENVMVYRQASELLRSRYNMLQMVIRERP